MKSRLIIVDISSFIFRAYYAISANLTAPDGTPVNAVRGVFSMVLKLLSDYQPTHIIMAKDRKEASFRKDLYEEYKANRSQPPEDLIPQFELIDNLIRKMGFECISIPKYEADDVIGSVAVQWKDEFDEVVIASGDKDLMQFIGGNVRMLDTMKDKFYDRQGVFEKMGVWPEQIMDYLSIVGDSSDNIPGMKGIGAKGAVALLEEYGDLESCIKNKDKMKGKRLINAFENHVKDALLSKELVKIISDLELEVEPKDSKYQLKVTEELISYLKNLGFNRALKQLEDIAFAEAHADVGEFGSISTKEEVSFEVEVISTKDKFKKLLKSIDNAKKVSLHIRWSTDNTVDAQPLCFAVSIDGKSGSFISIDMHEKKNLTEQEVIDLFRTTYGAKKKLVISDASKRDIAYALRNNIVIEADYFDLLQAHFVVDVSSKHEISYMAGRYLELTLADFNYKDGFEYADEGSASQFCNDRACAIFQMYDIITNELKEKNLEKLYYDIDLKLVKILAEMEMEGVKLNKKFFGELSKKYQKELDAINAKVHKITQEDINLKSPKQVSELLFETLDLPVIKKTKTGYSTDSEVLEELDAMGESEVPGLILKYRELDKILSTYVNVLPGLVNEKTGHIHTHFNQYVAATGRLSSDKPNLQNIPIRSENGRMIRKGFIAEPGNLLLSADYSQVELRILAHFSEDPAMLDAFNNSIDIHTRTASEILGVPVDKVTSNDRSSAKAVNFGLMYGQSSFGLARTLKISRSEAKEYITMYFERFSKVKGYLDHLKEKCEETGYAETMFGRKRYLPDIRSNNRTVKSMAERVAVNSPIQGTAADIIKVAMINIQKEMQTNNLKSKMILQVHDELIFEVPEEELIVMQELVTMNMEDAVKLKVPLKVDVGIGVNWFDLK